MPTTTTPAATPTTTPAATTASVFSTGYIDSSGSSAFAGAPVCYFSFSAATVASITAILNPDAGKSTESSVSSTGQETTTVAVDDDLFWKLIVTEFTENHEEKFSLHNTLSDSVAVFATGARPIEVSITGKLLTTPTESPGGDHRVEFLKKYIEAFRAKILHNDNKHLYFFTKDTVFNIYIKNLAMRNSVNLETYTDIIITGIAYKYKMLESVAATLYSYYGKTEILATWYDKETDAETTGV